MIPANTITQPQTGVSPETRAWRILLAAFLTFVALCAAAAYGVYWYLFQSARGMDIELTAARGTVRIVLPATEEEIAVTDRRPRLENGAIIRTDSTSQAFITLTDPRTDLPVASLVLFGDSQVELVQASSPRFRLNHDSYVIEFANLTGYGDLRLFGGNLSESAIVVSTPNGSQVFLDNPGKYSFVANALATQFTASDGTAVLVPRPGDRGISIPTGHTATFNEAEPTVRLTEAPRNLLLNGDFRFDYHIGWAIEQVGLPEGTAGTLEQTYLGGWNAILIDRAQSNWPGTVLDHGESGFIANINQDVSAFSSLELRATFYIAEQSLSTCGFRGSECPLMVRVLYEDAQGLEREIIQGFYAYRDPTISYPLRCETCPADHERIHASTWYTYSTGNILTNLPAEQRPETIRRVWFYASGHAYRVYVAEVSLFAAQ